MQWKQTLKKIGMDFRFLRNKRFTMCILRWDRVVSWQSSWHQTPKPNPITFNKGAKGPIHKDTEVTRGCNFFFGGGGGRGRVNGLSRLLHSFWADSIVRQTKMGDPWGKHTWPPASSTCLESCPYERKCCLSPCTLLSHIKHMSNSSSVCK